MSRSETPIKALLFDKDGTLFDFRATWENWAARIITELSGGDETVAGRIAHVIGFDLHKQSFLEHSLVIAGTNYEVATAIATVDGMADAATLDRMLAEAAHQAPVKEAVPLAALMDRLRRAGFVLGVMTNDTEAVAHAHLAQAGVSDRFAFICGSDSGHGAKPQPEPLWAFCRHVSVDPSNAAMVGDSTHDLIAARAAGMTGIGVLTGIARAPELAPHAHHILSDIGQLPEWLGMDSD